MHRQAFFRPLAAPRLPAVEGPQPSGKQQRQQQQGDRPVGDPAAETEMLDPVEPEETRRVDIGNVRPDDQCGHGEPGPALEPRLPDQRADEGMREVIHRFSGSHEATKMPSSTRRSPIIIGHSPEAVLEGGLPEIHLDRFQFDDQRTLDQQIELERVVYDNAVI